jgi:hypothetical protein
MGIKLEGSVSGTGIEATAQNEIKAALTLTSSQSGFAAMAAESDKGTVTGSRLSREVDIDEDFRLRVGQDAIVFSDTFPGSALNTNVWENASTTMTTTVTGGFCVLNAGSSAVTTVYAMIRSKPMFYTYGQAGLSVECLAVVNQVPQTNNITEWGAGVVATNATPTDGAFFRLTAAGQLVCVCNYGGTEVVDSPTGGFAALIGAGNARRYIIVLTDDMAAFWIDDVLVTRIARQATAGAITQSSSLSFFARTNNTGVTTLAQQVKIGAVSIQVMSADTNLPWEMAKSRAGNAPYQSQSGSTVAATTQYVNNTNPTAGVPTNTTSTVITGCGGLGWETATLAVAIDAVICSWLVPAGSAAVPGRTFMCFGAKVSSIVQTALTAGGFIENWNLCYGGSALSLLTAEGPTSKAFKRVQMGQRSVAATAAALAQLTDVELRLDKPVPIYPGEYINISKRITGTAATAGTFQHAVTLYGIML